MWLNVAALHQIVNRSVELGQQGDMTAWGHEMGEPIDPTAFAWNVADFRLGESLGYVNKILRYDRADVGWWGNLGDELAETPKQ
jgi:hypothetical protein